MKIEVSYQLRPYAQSWLDAIGKPQDATKFMLIYDHLPQVVYLVLVHDTPRVHRKHSPSFKSASVTMDYGEFQFANPNKIVETISKLVNDFYEVLR